MDFTLMTLPIRQSPDVYIPIGAIHIAQSLRDAGFAVEIINQDYYRYGDAEFIDRLRKSQPSMVGISAVVSTAYRAIKHYSVLIKKNFPHIPIILGGAASVSAEIILRYCAVDVVVVGEGEKTIRELFSKYSPSGRGYFDGKLGDISGLAFLDDGKFIFTGFREQITPLDDIPRPDFSFLDDHFSHYLLDLDKCADFSADPRSKNPEFANKKAIYLKTSRGCTNRCTFCHRYEKGWRTHGVDYVIDYMRFVKERYSVRFFYMADESFGCNKKWIAEFVEKVAELEVLWMCCGIRARDISPGLIEKYYEAGCVGLQYGFESGSDKMLAVMEKNATVIDNLRAAKITLRKKMNTIFQIIIGMPGESPETITETTEFLKKAFDDWFENELKISVNYIQALPGTPIYEYMKFRKMIESTIGGEERYLDFISDTDAASEKNPNFTDYPDYLVKMWKYKMISDVRKDFHSKRNWNSSLLISIAVHLERIIFKKKTFGRMNYHPFLEKFYLSKNFIKIVFSDIKVGGIGSFLKNMREYFWYIFFGRLKNDGFRYGEYVSLRDYMRSRGPKIENPEVKKLIEGF